MKSRLIHFFSKYQKVVLPKNKDILTPDQEITSIYYIKNGFLRSYLINEDGNETTLNIYKSGSYLPLSLALTRKVNPYFYQSMTPMTVYKAPFKEVIKFIKNDEELLYDLVKRLSSGIEGFIVRSQFLLRSDARQKVTSNLYLLSKRFGKKLSNGKIKIALPLIHQDIANMAGLSRETTSLILKDLEREGLVSRKGKIWTINNGSKLKQNSLIQIHKRAHPFSF
jgi:CRP/FNR family transcriptional regulator